MRAMADPRPRRIRIGIDTGGTFTDVVALDEDDGRAGHHQDPVHAGQPGGRVHGRHRQGARAARAAGRHGDAIAAVSHGTTVATNQLLEGKVGRLGFVTTEGYESMLEIARQSVPDGYGNSYFWVKPDRIVPARPGPGRRRPARLHRREVRPFDEAAARAVARWFRDAGHRHARRLLPALLRRPRARASDARRARRASTPTPSSRSPARCCASTASTSGPMTTLVDAAVKPRRLGVRREHRRAGSAPTPASAGVPVLRDEVQRRRAVRRRGRAPADHHRAVRAGRRRARRGAGRAGGRASTRCSPATAAAPRPTSPWSSTASRR